MFSSSAAKSQERVCSIQYMNNDHNRQQMLLSSQKKNDTIIEQEQDELFSLYITPYSQKEPRTMRVKDLCMNEETITLKASQRDDSLFQYRTQQYESEILRLKKIIMKKNQIIGELTEEIRIYANDYSSRRQRRRKQETRISSPKSSYNKTCNNQQCKKQISFFQKNNQELFEQTCKLNEKIQQIENQLDKKSKQLGDNKLLVKRMEIQNAQIRKQNKQLTKTTKKYLSDSAKQIKIVSKMREVLAQKLLLKEMNVHISGFIEPGILGNIKTEKSKQIRRQKEKKSRQPHSQDKRYSKQNLIRSKSTSNSHYYY